MINQTYPFKLELYQYKYEDFEPFIDSKTMYLHYEKHFQGYVDKLNNILKDYPKLQNITLENLIKMSAEYCDIESVNLRNQAGGVYNHDFYFKGLTIPNTTQAHGNLLNAINNEFGCFENFKYEFKQSALNVFGSGYTFLVLENGRLRIINTANQDVPNLNCYGLVFCVDSWEHVYYLKHYNNRSGYIDDLFNIINWNFMEQNYVGTDNNK